MIYYVGVSVRGKVTVEVDANTPGEAALLAEEIAENMDFGELEFEECEAINTYAECGYVEY